jgi:hypothetical protein
MKNHTEHFLQVQCICRRTFAMSLSTATILEIWATLLLVVLFIWVRVRR